MGELKLKSKHRLLCGDSTSEDDVARLMDGGKIDMVLTDPPYGVDYSGQYSTMFYGGRKGKSREKLSNDTTPDTMSGLIVEALSLQIAPIAFVWAAPQFHDIAKSAVIRCGYSVFSLIVWNKNHANFGAMGATYKPKYEMILACKRKAIPFWGEKNETTVWDCDRKSSNKFHPTEKPVELFSRATRNHTPRHGEVYDPFMGSGTTLIACEQLNRQCYGMGIDPLYCGVVVKRWENLTGEKAVLDG